MDSIAAERTSVVVVTYNSADVIGAAIASIDEGAEIIVVDNASSDGTAAALAAQPVRLVKNARNLGFGTACNVGAQAAEREFVLFLNPDAELMHGALDALVDAADARPECAAFNPRIIDSAGQQSQRRMSRLLAPEVNRRVRAPLTGDCDVEMLSGAALFCRRAAFDAVGGFDERIFLYCEDDDLAVRWRGAGHKLGYVHGAVVRHIGGASAPATADGERFKAYHFMRATRYTMAKHGRPFRRRYLTAQAGAKYLLALATFNGPQLWKYGGYLKALMEDREA